MLNEKYVLNEKLILKDINLVDIEKVIECLEEKYSVDDLEIVFWEDEECRDEGIVTEGYIPVSNNIRGLIKEARNLIYDWGYACVEIHNEYTTPIYFCDDEDEMIVY